VSGDGVRPAWRRIGTRVTLLAGALAVVLVLLPAVPREQVLLLQVGAGASAVEASFTAEGDATPQSTLRLHFPSGSPARVRHVLSLRNGRYLVRATVERGPSGSRTETSYERRVTLEGGKTVLFLEGPQ
jgi:hypothetical protein